MALKTAEKVETQRPVDPTANTTVLELSLYTKYTWGNVTYEKGKPYRFKNSDAMVLLGERDLDRPIWKMYHPPAARQAPRNEIVDATMRSAPIPVDEFGQDVQLSAPPKPKRLDIGDDSEIADILNQQDDDGGNVTV